MAWRFRIFENELSRFLPLLPIGQSLGQRMRKPRCEKISDSVFEKTKHIKSGMRRYYISLRVAIFSDQREGFLRSIFSLC